MMQTENLDAMTIREWPEMPNVFGQWPYLGVARLADEGVAIGIEGDADGSLCAWLAEASKKPPTRLRHVGGLSE